MTKKVLKPGTVTMNDYYHERFLNIETELRHQRELMKLGFENMNKRFEAIDKRFETIDKRFDTVDNKFESQDKKIEDLRADMNRRFEALTVRMDRFMAWSFGMTVSSTGIIIAAMKFMR